MSALKKLDLALFPLDDGCILIDEVSKLIRIKLIITITITILLTYLCVIFCHEAHGKWRKRWFFIGESNGEDVLFIT